MLNFLRFRDIAYHTLRNASADDADVAGTLGFTLSNWLEARYF
jgi:hypothetical protein